MKHKMTMYALLATVLLTSALMTACSNGEKAQPSADVESKPMEITWLSYYPPDKDDSIVQQYLEKRFQIKLKPMRIDRTNWADQLNIKLATGEVPDLFYMWGDEEVEKYSSQGLLAELPVDEIKKSMPKYAKTVDEMDILLWEYGKVNDKSYAVPQYWTAGNLSFLPAYNSKWLKAVGYNEPPKTLAELEEVLTKFRNNDPDGNGIKDTYGMSARGKDGILFAFNSVFGAFGVQDMWIDDGKGGLVYGPITDQAHEALKVLNRWYKAGLIDPEFVTEDAAKARANLANGRYGMTDNGQWHHLALETGNYLLDFKAKNPDDTLVVGKPVTGPSGEAKGFAWGSRNAQIGMGIQVAKDPAKKAKIYEILETLATDEEAYLMTTYGQEGVHYELKDGVPVMKPEFADQQRRGAQIGAGPFFSLFSGGKSTLMMIKDRSKEEYDISESLNKDVKVLINKKTFVVPAEKDFPDLGKIKNEEYFKFITGENDIEKGFDDFVTLWKKSGGQKVTDQVNEVYAERFKK